MSRWFRHYAGMMRDEKLVRAAMKAKQPVERVVWVWGALLESAAEINDGGRYDFDADEAGYFLRCEPGDLISIVDALCDLGRIDAGAVTKWGDRQYESDSSKERQQRYRDKHKASRDGEVTLQETDTEPDTKTKRQTAPSVPDAAEAGAGFDDLMEAFPQNPSSSETKAKVAFERIKPADRPSVIAAAQRFAKWFGQDCDARDRSIEAGLPYAPHLAKWLDSGAWREAINLPVKGELDPSLAIVDADSEDFKAIARHRESNGRKAPYVGASGKITVPIAELNQARAVH